MTKTPPTGPRGIIPEANYRPAPARARGHRPMNYAEAVRMATESTSDFPLAEHGALEVVVGRGAVASPESILRAVIPAHEKGQPEARPPVSYYEPTEEDRADFIAKVLPILEDACAEADVPFSARLLNLLCGAKPKSKRESAFRDELLRRIWAKYPGAAYPVMCWPAPAAVAPAVALH